MASLIAFEDWIEALDVDVIQGEFGYEEGEFAVYPELWRPSYRRGLTPLQAFQSALDAHTAAREAEEAERLANWERIKLSESHPQPTPEPRSEG